MTVMPGHEVEVIDLTEIVGDWAPLCDYAELSFCPKDPAAWVASLTRCPCGASGHRLVCSPCKDFIMQTEDCWQCRGCRAIIAPARLAYSRIEPLDKRP